MATTAPRAGRIASGTHAGLAGVAAGVLLIAVALWAFLTLLSGLGWLTTIGAVVLWPLGLIYLAIEIIRWDLWFMATGLVAALALVGSIALLYDRNVKSARSRLTAAAVTCLIGILAAWHASSTWSISRESGGWARARTVRLATKIIEAVDMAQAAQAGVRPETREIDFRRGPLTLVTVRPDLSDPTDRLTRLRRTVEQLSDARREALSDVMLGHLQFEIELARESMRWIEAREIDDDTSRLASLHRAMPVELRDLADTHRNATEQIVRLTLLETQDRWQREAELAGFWQRRLPGQLAMLDYVMPGLAERFQRDFEDGTGE